MTKAIPKTKYKTVPPAKKPSAKLKAQTAPGLAVMNRYASFASREPEQKRVIIEQTLKRALDDERLQDIADSFGLPISTLHYNLLAQSSDEWRDVQAARALTALTRAKEGLEHAKDGLELARAREVVRSAQWELEKLHRRLYGDKLDIHHSGNISITRTSYATDAAVQDAEVVTNKEISTG